MDTVADMGKDMDKEVGMDRDTDTGMDTDRDRDTGMDTDRDTGHLAWAWTSERYQCIGWPFHHQLSKLTRRNRTNSVARRYASDCVPYDGFPQSADSVSVRETR